MLLRSQRQLGLLAALFLIALLTTYGTLLHESSPYQISLSNLSAALPWASPSLGIGFVSRTYVISLPHRQDRRQDMEKLMDVLDMPTWHYHDATYANDSLVDNLMRKVQAQRVDASPTEQWSELPFSWPSDSNWNFTSHKPIRATKLPVAGSELWPDDPSHVDDELHPLICALNDFRLERHQEGLIQWRYLTPPRVATFHAHQSAVRRIVDDNSRLGADLSQYPGKEQTNVALILEDDVDMEWDIEKRMEQLLPLLPWDWDLLFLGYCWSEEDHFPAIVGEYSRPTKNQLHPSFTPRCLHAYALSPAGALRLLTGLRNPPFSYGRSIDEAVEWLVWKKKVKSFTVVPPVVIQRKITKTDITLEGGDLWKESLDRGVLGTQENGEEVR